MSDFHPTRFVVDHLNHDDLIGVGESGVGPWQDFVLNPGFSGALRYRLVPLGLQLSGMPQGLIELNVLRELGTLPPGYRPALLQGLSATVFTTTIGAALLLCYPDGIVMFGSSLAGPAGSPLIVNGVIPLD